uniref:Reverse transcriptase domain-containing protein n=1 Tax=Echeneis naucrates TaxID=173247 RepID=A0A665UXX1_ECHNA
MQWIKAIYYQPIARVKTNGVMSHPFQLYRSTRLGRPVSPAVAIRTNKNITGINFSEYDFKAFIVRPSLSVTIPLQYTLALHFFLWKPQGMKYLRIKIRFQINKKFDLNGPSVLKTIKDDIKRWTVLPLSLWGRPEVIKMNLLPRLPFLISAILLKFPQQWFKEIDKLFSSFLWQDKKPRINHKKLAMPRNKEGLDKNQYAIGTWEWMEESVISEYNKTNSIKSLWYHPKYDIKINNVLIEFSWEIVKAIYKRLFIN